MKNIIIFISLSAIALYLCYISFYDKPSVKNPTSQKSNQNSNVNKNGVMIVDSSAVGSKNNSVDFSPTKDSLLNANDASSLTTTNLKANIEQSKPQSANYGVTEGVAPDVNAQVASVADALKNSNHPERLSPLVQPKPFDRVQFEKDPKAYLDVIEPGRVFQSKNPENGVLAIQRISEAFVTIPQKDKTVLKVKALPHMPVSFTSFDLGAFQNKLTAITVQADKDGFAEATFIATEGTIAECNILCSCPETTGRVKFVITITKNNLFSQEK